MSGLANGLDPAWVAAHLPSRQDRAARARVLVEAHLAAHGGYVAWSGGKDSTTVVDLARQVDPGVPVCFFDSGLEYPENLAYIHALAETWKLNLDVIKAEPDALTIMAATGGWDHTAEVNWDAPDLSDALIYGPSATAHARWGTGRLWGLRVRESAGRRALLTSRRGLVRYNDGNVALAPIWDWPDLNVHAHLAARGIPENPVYTRLRELGAPDKSLRVGLAWDGNALHLGRATWLRRGWPELYDKIATALPRAREWR